jgi:formylglycine-generating enzyme required for sulfatase activity
MIDGDSGDRDGTGEIATGVPTRRLAAEPGPGREGRPAPDDLRMPLTPGTVLNNTHRIERLLARGGMGEVYRATNLLTGDAVALKLVRPELVNEPGMRALFLREATALRKIRHPAIVAYEGVHAEADGRVYLAMDLVEGPSLSSRVAERPLTVAQVRALRRRLAQGLLAAHEQNIVHRDLSPDNVVLRDGDLDKATIIDFGIAKRTDAVATSVIGSSFAGKMEYASPEQMGLFGNVVDQRSDVYSLGLVLAAAALGRPLGMAQTPALAVEARKRVPDLSRLPAALRDELAAMLQPDPARRLGSMREVLALDDAAPAPPRARGGVRRGRVVTAVVAAVVAVAALLVIARPGWVADSVTRVGGLLGLSAGQAPDVAADDAAWNRAHAANTIPALREYMTRYPAGQHVAQARTLIAALDRREAAARSTPGTVFRDCPGCPEMVRLPAGTFEMGSAPEERQREGVPAVWAAAEGPPHKVTIGQAFSMARYEVTLGEFAMFVQATGYAMGDSCWRNPGFEQGYQEPVTCVSWSDARAYAAWLGRTTGRTYRLPTEAEWEYAARAGTTTTRYWGDDLQDVCAYANVLETVVRCVDGYNHTAPVGEFKPNGFRLYDMLGNVAEWTEDCWTAGYDGAPVDGSARLSGNCALRIVRGGSWNAEPWRVRAAARSGISAGTRNGEVGFRLVRVD